MSDDPSMQSALVLYSALKAHKFMAELIERRFERHPVMAATFKGFLFSERASHGDIKRLEIKLGKLSNLTRTLQSKVDKKWNVTSFGCADIPKVDDSRNKDVLVVEELKMVVGREKSGGKKGRSSKDRSGKLNGPSPLIQWSFGEGSEGICIQPSICSDSVLVVGKRVPWRGMVVARLDLRIHSILLSDMHLSYLVSCYFGSEIPVGQSIDQSNQDMCVTREALQASVVVVTEKLPKASAVLSEMWTRPMTRLILVAHGKLIPPPVGWNLCQQKVPHGHVGGVTNLLGHIGLYFRSKHVDVQATLVSASRPSRPRRDPRSVLKLAVGGHRCGAPSFPAQKSSVLVGEEVVEVRPGAVLNSGLLGIKTDGGLLRLPRVKTLFGGGVWAIRKLTPSEVLAFWDVPENGNGEWERRTYEGNFHSC
jgi:hypothetical protein